jgi:hypothetical protein
MWHDLADRAKCRIPKCKPIRLIGYHAFTATDHAAGLIKADYLIRFRRLDSRRTIATLADTVPISKFKKRGAAKSRAAAQRRLQSTRRLIAGPAMPAHNQRPQLVMDGFRDAA